MQYGTFIQGGRVYRVDTPRTPGAWHNLLFNDEYSLEASLHLQGKSHAHRGYAPAVNTTGYRHFYVLFRDDGDVCCPLLHPLKAEPTGYACEHGLGYSAVEVMYRGVHFHVRVFVPVVGQREIWTVTMTNTTAEAQAISLFSVFPFEGGGPMGGECRRMPGRNLLYRYAFPYHVAYADKANVERKQTWSYVVSSSDMASHDGSRQRFYGSEDLMDVPGAVRNGTCSDIDGEGEDFVAALEHRLSLAPNGTAQIHLVVGVASSRKELEAVASSFPDAKEEFNAVEALWTERCGAFQVESPEPELNHLANYWLKKQVVYLARLNRGTNYCPARNPLQDALGYALIDPPGALDLALQVLRRQRSDGYLKQWYMTDDAPPKPLCAANHSDAPFWLILCMIEVIDKNGDAQVYNQLESYCDDGSSPESIWTHLLKAALFMAGRTGRHGLCLMLDGDWTDPVNGPGREGRGESTWNSMALLYAIRRLLEVRHDDRLPAIAERIEDAINRHAWDGEWYVAGFDDEGHPFGSAKDDEGRLFLNAQTWAIISGVARGDRLVRVRRSIETLATPCGYLLLAPPFTKWNDVWGRISIKQAGTTENGSVYCHASMFKAFADTLIDDGEAAVQTLIDTLPTNPKNPPERNLQLPLFIPNFYFGLRNENFGRSSGHYGTGSTAWWLWVLVEHVFGARATCEGLKVSPNLPAAWREAKLTRRHKNSTYELRYHEGVADVLKRDS